MKKPEIRKSDIQYTAFLLLTALAGALLLIPMGLLFDAYWPSLPSLVPVYGPAIRLMLINSAAWCAGIFIGWLPLRHFLFFDVNTDDDKVAARKYCRLAFFAAAVETVWMVLSTVLIGMKPLPAKLIGCVVFLLLVIGLARPYLTPKKKKTEASSNRFLRFIQRFVYSEVKPYKFLKDPFFGAMLRAAGIAWAICLPLACYLSTEFIHYADQSSFHELFVNFPGAVTLALSILYLLYLVVLLLVKHVWIASLIFSFVMSGSAVADYFKYALTGENFYPWDLIQQTGNLGEAMSFVKIPLPGFAITLFVFLAVMTLIAAFSRVTIPLRYPVRLPVALLAALCMYAGVSTPQNIDDLLARHNLSLLDMALQQSNYSANGFTTAFAINVFSLNVAEPDGYSENAIGDILSPYTDREASDTFSSPDIILILSESFWDPKVLPGTTYSENPTANFDEICTRPNTYSGQFYTSALGGGTVRPEFEVLTGLISDYLPSGSIPWQYVKKEMPSFVSLYQDMGYHTFSVHPYLSAFYSRRQAYPLIGFDETFFSDELEALDAVPYVGRGWQASDETFVNYLKYYLDADAEKDVPSFAFGISMENHQPYENKFEETTVCVYNDSFTDETRALLENYVQGVKDADEALAQLVDYIDNRSRDTILIFFGDHLPSLGASFAAYQQSGMLAGSVISTPEEMQTMHVTPFLIYSNFTLGESEIVKPGNGNAIGSYELMNAASQLIGAPQTRYMQFLTDFYHEIPYYNFRLGITPDASTEAYINAQKLVTYDLLRGKQYAFKK